MLPEFPAALIAPADVIVALAHQNNYGYGKPNLPKALCLHVPEEDADDNEVTPRWFQNPDARASTHYYADSDGDLYQMVPDNEGAYAQGVTSAQRHWKGQPGVSAPWANGVSNNLRALSMEIEGRAHNFRWSAEQFRTVAMWIAFKCDQYGIPMDRDHIVGHEELASHKRDPGIEYGTFDIDALIAEAQVFSESLTPDRKPPPLSRMEHTMAAWRGRTTTVPREYRGSDRVYELIVREKQ